MASHNEVSRPLTVREKAFCAAMIELHNGKEAAIKAGYSAATASVAACKLLQRPGVKRLLAKLRFHENERAKKRLDAVYEQLGHALTRVGTDFIDGKTGEFIDVHDLPERANASIDGIEVTERYDKDGGKTVKTKLKLVPKATAMDMALKVLGGYEKSSGANTQVNVNVDNRRVVLSLPDNGTNGEIIQQ